MVVVGVRDSPACSVCGCLLGVAGSRGRGVGAGLGGGVGFLVGGAGG